MSFMTVTRQPLIALAVLAAIFTVNPPAHAANTNGPAPRVAPDRLAVMQERMKEAVRELNLTPEQVGKLKTIVRERMEKLQALRQDSSLSANEKRQKLAAARAEILTEVKKVLTPDQFEKWKARMGLTAGSPATPLARVRAAINDLNLTEEQKDQLQPLYQEQMQKLRELRDDPSLSMAEKLDRLKALHQEVAPRLKKVLTAEQCAKWEKDVNQWLDQLRQLLQGQK